MEWAAQSTGDDWDASTIALGVVTFVVMFVVVPIIGWKGAERERRHQRQIAAWARSRPAVEYRIEDDRFAHRFLGAPFGHTRRFGGDPLCRNVACGVDGGPPFVHLDYHPPDSDLVTCVVAVSLPRQFPELILRSYLELGGYHLPLQGQMQTESEAFNRRYQIFARDERAAHGMLNPRVIGCLLTLPDHVSVRVERADILCYRRERLFGPKEYTAVLEALQEISELLPHYFAIP